MKFVIVCADYEVERKTRDAAERELAGIEALGACANDHSIEEREA